MKLKKDTIVAGDCRKISRRIKSERVDLVLTDPPFNIGAKYPDYNDAQPEAEFLAMLGEAMAQSYRVLKPDGSAFVFMGANLQAEVLVLLKQIGFHHRRTICWHQTFGQAQQGNFTPSWVAIHYMVKNPTSYTFSADSIRVPSQRQLRYNDKRANPKGKLPDDTWVLLPDLYPDLFRPESDCWLQPRVCGTFTERVAHVNQLPLPVVERIIRAASNPGDWVLDPFCGSGTVCLPAQKLGRRYLGIELCEVTAEMARCRLVDAVALATTKPHKVFCSFKESHR